jgi:HK97 family phage prohead protease
MERKTFDLKMADDGWMIASTPAVDRDRDRVMPKGANLRNFENNPVLMFGHNYADPWALIGRAKDLSVTDGEIRFRPELRQPANENDPMTIIQALWDQGLLKAASIGFNPLEYKDNTFGGRDFTSWELLEISLVPLPANQEALRLAVKAMGAMKELVASETVTTPTGQAITINVNLQREPVATVTDNDTADEPTDTEQPTAQVAGDATQEDELTPEEEAALTELLENVAVTLVAVLEEE